MLGKNNCAQCMLRTRRIDKHTYSVTIALLRVLHLCFIGGVAYAPHPFSLLPLVVSLPTPLLLTPVSTFDTPATAAIRRGGAGARNTTALTDTTAT